jgi:hypothetical protein
MAERLDLTNVAEGKPEDFAPDAEGKSSVIFPIDRSKSSPILTPAHLSRLVVKEMIVHRQMMASTGSPIIDSGFVRVLESGEQVYQRRMEIGKDWQPVDLGWLAEPGCSMIMIENREGGNLQVVPTEEEKQTIAAKVVEIVLDQQSTGYNVLQVHPKESQRISPTRPDLCLIRCRSGKANIVVTAFPK